MDYNCEMRIETKFSELWTRGCFNNNSDADNQTNHSIPFHSLKYLRCYNHWRRLQCIMTMCVYVLLVFFIIILFILGIIENIFQLNDSNSRVCDNNDNDDKVILIIPYSFSSQILTHKWIHNQTTNLVDDSSMECQSKIDWN